MAQDLVILLTPVPLAPATFVPEEFVTSYFQFTSPGVLDFTSHSTFWFSVSMTKLLASPFRFLGRVIVTVAWAALTVIFVVAEKTYAPASPVYEVAVPRLTASPL